MKAELKSFVDQVKLQQLIDLATRKVATLSTLSTVDPDASVDLALDAMDALSTAVDLLLKEVEGDELFVKAAKRDARKRAA